MLSLRKATAADIPMLAQVMYESTLPPVNHCFWDDVLDGTQTTTHQFLEALLLTKAGNWGNVDDFWVLEEEGKPVAAAAGYLPNAEEYRPLLLDRLGAIAQKLGWSDDVTALFAEQYQQVWGPHPKPPFLAPYAPWVIETVAVLPDYRGRGLGKNLIHKLLEKGKAAGHSYAGITVINGNEAARHTYEAAGFQPYQAWHADYFMREFQIEFSGLTKFCCSFT